MQTADISEHVDYIYWMRDRIVTAAANLSTDAFLASQTVTNRDLHATLVHELDVEWSWRERLRGADPTEWGPEAELEAADYPTLDALVEHWRRDEAEMRSWITGLTDADLAAPPADERAMLPLWYYVMHLVSHAIQQFSEAAVLLTRAGHSPGDIGFLEFAEQRAGRR